MFAGGLLATRSLVSCLKPSKSVGLLFKQSTWEARTCLQLSTGPNVSLNHQQQQEKTQTPHDDNPIEKTDAMINITFSRPDGSKVTIKTSQGKTLYDAVIDSNVDIDGFGACGGTLCCTTCHLIFKQADYEKVGEPSVEEMDMLELAHGLEDTSRLGCQVILKKDYDPLEVYVPENINDVREG